MRPPRDIGAVPAAGIIAEFEDRSGVWGQTAPTRVWAAPTVLRLGLVLSPEFGRGEATSRTRWVPPANKKSAPSVLRHRGEPTVFACGFGSAWVYARQQERRPAHFAGLPPCAGRCEDGPQSGSAEAVRL
jgi:hypothetical protein